MTDGILVFDNFGILIHYNPASIRNAQNKKMHYPLMIFLEQNLRYLLKKS